MELTLHRIQHTHTLTLKHDLKLHICHFEAETTSITRSHLQIFHPKCFFLLSNAAGLRGGVKVCCSLPWKSWTIKITRLAHNGDKPSWWRNVHRNFSYLLHYNPPCCPVGSEYHTLVINVPEEVHGVDLTSSHSPKSLTTLTLCIDCRVKSADGWNVPQRKKEHSVTKDRPVSQKDMTQKFMAFSSFSWLGLNMNKSAEQHPKISPF